MHGNIESGLAGGPGVGQVTVDAGARRVRIDYDQTGRSSCGPRLSEIGHPPGP